MELGCLNPTDNQMKNSKQKEGGTAKADPKINSN